MLEKSIAPTKIEELQQAAREIADEDIDVSIYVGREKMEVMNNFALIFYNSFLSIIDDYNLNKTEIKAVLKILEYMQFGNLIRMSFAQLARDIGVDPKNISKVIKKLKDAKLLVEQSSNLYFNPHVITKGRFKRKVESDCKLLEYSAEQLKEIGLAPSILTPKMKKQILKEKMENLNLNS